MPKANFYRWQLLFGGMDISELERLRELERENWPLKQVYAESRLENMALKEVVEKISVTGGKTRTGLFFSSLSRDPLPDCLSSNVFESFGLPLPVGRWQKRSGDCGPFRVGRSVFALRVDNGAVLISIKLATWAEQHGVTLESIKPNRPVHNGFVKRLNRTYRTELLDVFVFKYLKEVEEINDDWGNQYNEERPHELLAIPAPKKSF